MIRSMTGYGAAERTNDQVRIAVEIRTVNNRFFKANQNLPEGLGAVEMTIENLLRASISRGTISLNLTVEPKGAAEGLVDFPAMLNGRLVYLCWKLGEPEVQYWHDLEAGFQGRQPLGKQTAEGPDEEALD